MRSNGRLQRLEDQVRRLSGREAEELTIKELKSGLHLGQTQVTQDKARVTRSVALSVVAYLLLVRLYGGEERLGKT